MGLWTSPPAPITRFARCSAWPLRTLAELLRCRRRAWPANRGRPQRKFLEAILADLRRGGLVVGPRGSAGGYRLALPAEELTLGMVVRTVDGPLAEVRGLRPHQTAYEGVAQHLPVVWVALRASMRHVLDGVTLADLVAGELPEHVRGLAEEPDALPTMRRDSLRSVGSGRITPCTRMP